MLKKCVFYEGAQTFEGVTRAIYTNSEKAGQSIDLDGFKYSKVVTVILQLRGNAAYVTNKKLFFLNDAEINNNTIVAIELLSLTNARAINTSPQTDLQPNADIKKGYLTLVDDCKAIVTQTPLSNLALSQNGNQLCLFNVSNCLWGASYIRFVDAAGLGTTNSLQFNVYLK